jgi:hypothetical protein
MTLYIRPKVGETPSDLISCENANGHKLFRKMFVHLKIKNDSLTYELADDEVWEQDNSLVANIDSVLV